MKDFIDILADSLKGNKKESEIMRLVERLYFNYVRNFSFPWQKPWIKSEEFKIAQDIILLENGVKIHSTIKDKGAELVSATIRNEFGLENSKESRKSDEDNKADENTARKADEARTEIDDNYAKYLSRDILEPQDKRTIESQILNKYRYYVTAIMITELISDEKTKTTNNKIISYVLPIFLALITVLGGIGGIVLKSYIDSPFAGDFWKKIRVTNM